MQHLQSNSSPNSSSYLKVCAFYPVCTLIDHILFRMSDLSVAPDSTDSSIPNEIWHECWVLVPRSDLSNVCRVSKNFLSICQPLIFHDAASFLVGERYPESASWRDRKSYLLRMQNKFTRIPPLHLREMVTSSMINGHAELQAKTGKLRELYFEALGVFVRSIHNFQNITTIQIDNVTITEEVSSSLAELKLLRHLFVKDCTMYTAGRSERSPMILETFDIQRSVVQLNPLPLNPPSDKRQQPLVLGPIPAESLKTLCLEPSIMLGTYLEHLPPDSSHSCLTTLSVNARDITSSALLGLLAQCPELLSFTIYAPYSNFRDTFDLPSASIPRLTTYRGPMRFAKTFVPGRPIEVVMFNNPLEGRCTAVEALNAVAQSTATIRHLQVYGLIHKAKELFDLVCGLFPGLKRLVVGFDFSLIEYADLPDETAETEDDNMAYDDEDDGGNDSSSSSEDDGANNSSSSSEESEEDFLDGEPGSQAKAIRRANKPLLRDLTRMAKEFHVNLNVSGYDSQASRAAVLPVASERLQVIVFHVLLTYADC